MAMVRRMHSDGLISPEEYAKVERIFFKKYKPLIGTVYAGMALTPCPSWGIYGEGDTNEDYTHRADCGDTCAQKESGGVCPCFNGV